MITIYTSSETKETNAVYPLTALLVLIFSILGAFLFAAPIALFLIIWLLEPVLYSKQIKKILKYLIPILTICSVVVYGGMNNGLTHLETVSLTLFTLFIYFFGVWVAKNDKEI